MWFLQMTTKLSFLQFQLYYINSIIRKLLITALQVFFSVSEFILQERDAQILFHGLA